MNLIATIPQKAHPLSSYNMLKAGVDAKDVIRFRLMKPAEQMRHLQTIDGQAMLDKVRAQERQKTESASHGLTFTLA